MFYDSQVVSKVGLTHFDEGVRGAVSEAMASLKQAYALAVPHYGYAERKAQILRAGTTPSARPN